MSDILVIGSVIDHVEILRSGLGADLEAGFVTGATIMADGGSCPVT